MQGHSPVKRRRSESLFSKFCMDMEILPSYTPLFMIDINGRIVNKKKLVTSEENFESIYGLADEQEASFMLEQSRMCDAYAVKGKVDDGRNFIVVSKDKDGFSRCVVCSYSEDKCIKLHDYIEKLCSYKDYLDSFTNLAFSSMARLPVKRLFKMKLSGALELVELASVRNDGNEKRISFPVTLALEKLSAFASKTNGAEVELLREETDNRAVVNAPESFFRLAVSAMALVNRHSKGGAVSVCAKTADTEDTVRITFSAKGTGKKDDIYERALISALEAKGFDCGVREADGRYTLFIDVKTEKRAEPVLSDVQAVSVRLDGLMAQEILLDMYFTVSDI